MIFYFHFLAFQGAKNHGVIMPDANKEATLNAVREETVFNVYSDVESSICF